MGKPVHRAKRNRRTNAAIDVARFNKQHAVGTRVEYWSGFRSGPGTISTTRSEAWNCCGAAVVLIEGARGGIALTHVEVLR